MKSLPFLIAALSSFAILQAKQEYIGTLEFTVNETNPEQLKRAQSLVKERFTYALVETPYINFHQENIRTEGPRVIITMGSRLDVRQPMVERIAQVVNNLSGYVDGAGDFEYYQIPDPLGNLVVRTDSETNTHIEYIYAKDVPLEDLLEAIKAKVNRKKVPFEVTASKKCRQKNISIQYGDEDGTLISVNDFVKRLSERYHIRYTKIFSPNPIYVFADSCDDQVAGKLEPIAGFLPNILSPQTAMMPMQVNFIER